jgi:hypothetical protein
LLKNLALLALSLVAALVLFTPTNCGCRMDLHRGDPLHLVFDHPHPPATAEADDLQASTDAPRVQDARALDASGPMVASGEVLPRPAVRADSPPWLERLLRSANISPSGVNPAPVDPPPRLG